jgi:hypothetical protein
MKQIDIKVFVRKGTVTLLVVWLLVIVPAWGQTGGDFDLTWSTIDGGGGTSSGGDFTLRGTIGQLDAGVMTGGDYELLGGFLPGVPICIVDFHHLARFAEYWLNTGTGLAADLDGDNDADLADLKLLADEWLNCCPVNWPLK